MAEQEPAPPALELRDVWLSYQSTPVLEAVNLTLRQHEFVGLIGPNGAGKTVLLKVVLGLLRPDRGTVRVFGKAPEKVRGQIAYVPQYPKFDASFPIRVRDVVLMGRLGRERLLRGYNAADRERAMKALELVDLVDLAERQIGKLSGGQLQRVLIARALAVDTRLLLLDEPTASLDARIAGELYALLSRLASQMTVVLVSHDVGVMYRHVTSIACLNRRLYFHPSRELTEEMLETLYGFPADIVVHGHTHRLLEGHGQRREEP